MTTFLRAFNYTWQVLICVLLAAPLCLAQVQYANDVVLGQNAGFVFGDKNAADGNLTTNATVAPGLLLSYARLRVSFPKMAQANKPAGIYLRPSDPLLDLSVAGLAVVNTYLQTGNITTPGETFALSGGLVNLSLLNSGMTEVDFTPTKPFNQMEVLVFSVLSVGQNIGVYEAFSTPVAPLPVVLTAFQGKATPTGAALQWETASEANTSHFVVERATEAGGAFRAIGRVEAAGNSAQTRRYQLVDTAPDLLNYYRLRQVDLDGTEAFSPVVVVQKLPSEGTLAVYPNPATDLLTVAGPVGTAFILVDLAGHRVGGATITEAHLPQVDVRSLPAGLYFVQAATGSRTKFTKVAP